jgi:transcription elongation factor S-II
VVKPAPLPPPPPVEPSLERRDSSATFDPSEYWSDLPSNRQNICQKLYEILLLAKAKVLSHATAVHADAVPFLVGQRASEVELALYELHCGANGGGMKSYVDKARSLAFNLKKNLELSASVILGDDDQVAFDASETSKTAPPPPPGISAHDLVRMTSDQLASDQTRVARAREVQKVIDSKRLDWEQANEDKINEMCGIRGELLKASLFTCSRCKSTKTTSTQKQTRSADEPMTVFVLCMNCGKRWKC